MKIVADTSSYIAVVLNESTKEHILRLTTGHTLIAPAVLPFEIGNALIAQHKRGHIDAPVVAAAWKAGLNIGYAIHKIDVAASLRLATQQKIYAYDAYFLQCALEVRAPLLTLDRKMNQIARLLEIETLEI